MKQAAFVLDNSVAMAWCFRDEKNPYADAVFEALETGQALAPAIWPLEAGNVLLTAERRNRIDHAGVVHFLSLFQKLSIKIEQEPPERMFAEIVSLARTLHLTTYDASYLDLAMRTGLPIATQDKTLAKAAKKHHVAIFHPKPSSGKPA